MYFIILLLSFAVSAAVSSPQQLLTNELTAHFSAPDDGTYLTGLPNMTSLLLNSSISSALRTDCNARFSGSQLNLQSCIQAFGQIEATTEMKIWQRRSTRTQRSDIFALPYRWLSQDGRCSIQVFLIDFRTLEARASMGQIQQAASALIQRCAPSSGGIAVNIGGDNNLAIVLSKTSNPNVRCYGSPSFPGPDACEQLISFVDADERQLVWGPSGYPGVTVGLPVTVIGPTPSCVARLTTAGGPDTASWYEAWAQLSAILSMCFHKSGVLGSSSFGKFASLRVAIF